ncbi:hypothetical protein UAW_00627 [Enterococcus haemoperoxidus ATCC BAA-382]|uniref:Uncharacterized protein n=1 Tax=Enterococcus haemoperoxidus ATCC BAA-382 TaxID=1158608 RepID=R2SW91_9ENTE|nr:hypothetical protein [Enterococcus haemoperoxidus]EOH99475.1 hypothetical protein UAW_00627 [Enterococcus haemoperoxidus ATCC BAA-382]EOT62785.1 hypothetical protein I583_01786 [Enterococcus haemoperoxidus ATCC BAA-382]OJG48184.1 hypothetical protein RV06_GL002518 [Enterococcus haemoperoxidus]
MGIGLNTRAKDLRTDDGIDARNYGVNRLPKGWSSNDYNVRGQRGSLVVDNLGRRRISVDRTTGKTTYYSATGETLGEKELPKQAGLGQSNGGRHEPLDLDEELAMEEAMNNPSSGKELQGKNTDPRWPSSDGWEKWTKNVNGTEVHYQYNPKTVQIDDVKIKPKKGN